MLSMPTMFAMPMQHDNASTVLHATQKPACHMLRLQTVPLLLIEARHMHLKFEVGHDIPVL